MWAAACFWTVYMCISSISCSAVRSHKKVESTAHSKSLHQSLVVSCPKAKWPRKYISPPTEIDPYFTLSRIQGYTSHFSENKAIAIYITACFGHNCKTVYHHALETHLQMDHLNLVWAKTFGALHWFIIMRIRNTAQRPWNSWNVGFPWWVFGVVAPKVCSAGPAHQGWRDGNRTGSTTTPVAAEHNGNLRPQVLVRKCENVWNIRISTPTASTTSRSRKMNIL